MTTDPIAANQDFIDAWTFWTRRSPRGSVDSARGLISPWMSTAWPVGNLSFLSEPVSDEADLKSRIGAALDHAQGVGLGWLLFICLELLPDELRGHLNSLLGGQGMAQVLPMTGMIASDLSPPRHPLPKLSIRPVADAVTRRDFALVNSAAYEIPDEWVLQTLDLEALWDEKSFGFVGYLDDEAVTTTTAILLTGRLYIGLVATRPEHQHRGYAERIMRYTVAAAQAAIGIRQPLILHATPAGFPLYRDMGFEASGHFVGFAPTQEGH